MADKLIKPKYLPPTSDPLLFDYTKVDPTFYTILQMASPTVLQAIVIDPLTDEIYASQSYSNPAGKAESYRISRMDRNGNLLDSMILEYGGHGTTFGIEHVNGAIRIWTNFCETDASGATTAYRVCRLPYRPNETVTINDPTLIKFATFGLGYVIPVCDEENNYVAYRYTTGGVQRIERRKISEVKTGVDKVYGTIDIPAELDYMQGFCIDGDDMYWRTGDTNDATTLDYIVRFSFVDGKEKQRLRCKFGAGIDGTFEENFREPEGIFMYKDPISGRKSLLAGVVTGGTGRRICKVFGFHSIGNGEKFANKTGESIQRYPLTRSTGIAKGIDPTLTKMSDVRKPGTYYMNTAQSAAFTDHPMPNIAGWYLEVGAPDAAGNVFQTLRRNTPTTANLMIFERNVQAGGQTDWMRSFGTLAQVIPSSTKSLSLITTTGNYYMTSAIATAMTDHPHPDNGGWFLKVEEEDAASGAIYQTLMRNTGVGNHERWIRCMQTVSGSSTVYEETPWERIGGSYTMDFPSSANKISLVFKPGTYYMSGAKADTLLDHPAPQTSGWFLVNELRDAGNDSVYQTLTKITGVANHERWIRCITPTAGVYNNGEWEKVGGYFMRGIPTATAMTSINMPGTYYMSTAQSSALTDHPLPGVAGWILEVTQRNTSDTFIQILTRNSGIKGEMQQYTRRVIGSTGGPWKNMFSERKTLWSGTTKGDFSTTFTLSEPLSNFDMIYFKIDSDAGLNANERVVFMSEWQSDELQFQMINLSNVVGNTGFWLFELALQFNAAKDNFTMKRAIRLAFSSTGTQTRTDSDATMGLQSIIGVRF